MILHVHASFWIWGRVQIRFMLLYIWTFKIALRDLALSNLHTYRDGIDLFTGGQVMSSNEGTAQGDPLEMIRYALATMPLIQSLRSNEVVQAWHADDASAIGEVSDLFTWWKSLLIEGPTVVTN